MYRTERMGAGLFGGGSEKKDRQQQDGGLRQKQQIEELIEIKVNSKLADYDGRILKLTEIVQRLVDEHKSIETKGDMFRELHLKTHEELVNVQMKCTAMEAKMNTFIEAVQIAGDHRQPRSREWDSFSRDERRSLTYA